MISKFRFCVILHFFPRFGFFLLRRHTIQTQANTMIIATKKDLQKLNVVVRHGDKQQKIQVEKLTSEFQSIVEMYSACQKVWIF